MNSNYTKTKASTEPMFSAISKRYDLCNHLFSFGLDFYWRKKAVKSCCKKPIESALDICCGTGDMAFTLAATKKIKKITACDESLAMLECAQKKQSILNKKNKNIDIIWSHKPVEDLMLPKESFDVITCAFGLRNVVDPSKVVNRMHSLLKPGGTICILEFFLPQNRFLRCGYLFYLCKIMPWVAGIIAGNVAPWLYLADSIQKWEKFDLQKCLHEDNFSDIKIKPLSLSAVHITTAQKK